MLPAELESLFVLEAPVSQTTAAFPTGIVTLVFTDIEGSSDLWEQHRGAFHASLEEHNRLMREAAARWNGVEVKTVGDAFLLAFAKPSDAVQWAVDAQQSLAQHEWPPDIGAIRVRIGMHTGDPILGQHPNGVWDYFGPPVNRAARVEAAGHGGQTLVSNSARELAQPELPPDIAFLDLGVHRLKGVGEERLWQVLHPHLPGEFPPLKTLSPERHNLPLPPTPFIGREEQIEEWRGLLLEPTTRLLTLVGFGGMGKTRSALQLAELCADAFAQGVRWVEAEEDRTGDAMIERIAYQLRLHLEPPQSAKEQLLNYLRQQELLLVLDNTEQIPDAAQAVNALLRAAPNVKCLVTSRRPLELQVERLASVQPLPTSEAETLFVERARARRADFTVTEESAADVAQLCRRLEGVPLAIELAASRITGMTPREILNRLGDRLRVLQTRAPDLPPRQRALRGAIDWSYELLTEEDKELFAQIAVFAGGFKMEDAEAICEAFDVFEGVSELGRHSLLRTETDSATQQTRYVMLESVRDYAAEKLQGFTETGRQVRQRHAEHYLRFAEDRIKLMRTRNETQALDELGVEVDNLRAAMAWAKQLAVSHGSDVGAELCARLALALHQLLYHAGFWTEALQCLNAGWEATEAVAAEAPVSRRGLQAAIGRDLAGLALDMGNLAEARVQAEASLSRYRELRDQRGTAEALNVLGLVATEEGDTEGAQQCFEEVSRLRADPHGQAIALHNLARLASRRGEVAEARRLYGEALVHRRASGDVRGEATTSGNLGALEHNAGNHSEARSLYHEALGIYRALRDLHGIAVMLNNLGELGEARDDVASAIALYVHAQRIFGDLRSAHERIPAEHLQRLAGQLGQERFDELRQGAEQTTWEEVVEG